MNAGHFIETIATSSLDACVNPPTFICENMN